jgi:uncharacterized membrane protein YozB (DUF420 family)
MGLLLWGTSLTAVTTPFGANLSLVVMLVAAVLFTIGWRLAVGKRFEAHRWVMTIAVCLNAVLVIAWMVRSFVLYVAPELPAKLGQAAYGITTVHAVVGAIGLVLGVFVALRGNGLVPKALRFTNYKAFMRAAYAVYLLATVLGVLVYVNTYVHAI